MSEPEQPLRILHVLRSPVGGLFRHVVDLVRGQSARGHRVGLLCDSLTGGEHAARVLDGLSRLELRREGRDFAAVTEGLVRNAQTVSTVALITGARTPVPVIRRAADRFGPDVRVLAVRAEEGAEVAHRAVGRLRVLTIGALGDLPRLLRRAAVA